MGVFNDINLNNILNRRPASSASNADKNRGHTNFTNILNHRQASTASNADKNRGHRIDGLLCQITGNNDAEMGVEGDLTAVYITEYITTGYLTARNTDKEDDLTAVNGTEYLTAGNNNEVEGGCNVRRLRNIQWDQYKDLDLAGGYLVE